MPSSIKRKSASTSVKKTWRKAAVVKDGKRMKKAVFIKDGKACVRDGKTTSGKYRYVSVKVATSRKVNKSHK